MLHNLKRTNGHKKGTKQCSGKLDTGPHVLPVVPFPLTLWLELTSHQMRCTVQTGEWFCPGSHGISDQIISQCTTSELCLTSGRNRCACPRRSYQAHTALCGTPNRSYRFAPSFRLFLLFGYLLRG